MGKENQMILEEDSRDPRRHKALSYIVERMLPGNAMRTATSYIEEVVKTMCNGIAPLYVHHLRKSRAPSYNVEGMRAMRGCAKLLKRAVAILLMRHDYFYLP